MSDEQHPDPTTDAPSASGSSDVDARLADAMRSFAAGIEPAAEVAWSKIDDRLGATAPARATARDRIGSPTGQRALVAAAIVVTVMLAAGVMLLARRGDDGVRVATQPSTIAPAVDTTSIVAITKDRSLVELDLEGQLERVIVPSGDRMMLIGKPVISRGTVYVERAVEADCNDWVYPRIGEIVAVPLAGGAPTVVAAAGAAPAIAPGGAALAYVGPLDGSHCGGPDRLSVLRLLDLASGVTTEVSVSVPGTGPASALVPVWTSPTTLVVLAQQPGHSCPAGAAASDCAIRQYVTVDTATDSVRVVSSDRQTRQTVGPFDVMQVSATQSFGVVSSPAGSGADATVRLVAAGYRDGAMFLDEVIIEVATGSGKTSPLAVVDASLLDVAGQGGDPSFVPGVATVDASPDGARVLIAAARQCSPLANCVELASSSALLVWDGQVLRELTDGIIAAAFVTGPRPADAPGPIDATDPPDVIDPNMAAPGTTAIDASTPGTLGGPAIPADADRTEIQLAFDLTFHGDFSRLQDGEEIRPATKVGAEVHPELTTGIQVQLTRIEYLGADRARVDFRLLKDGLDVTAPATGGAVRVDGVWMVTKATMCDLLARSSIPCPGGNPPTG